MNVMVLEGLGQASPVSLKLPPRAAGGGLRIPGGAPPTVTVETPAPSAEAPLAPSPRLGARPAALVKLMESFPGGVLGLAAAGFLSLSLLQTGTLFGFLSGGRRRRRR